MKKKEKLMIILVLAVSAILFIVGGILLFQKNSRYEYYQCKNTSFESDTYTIYYLYDIKTENNRVLSAKVTGKMEFASKKDYQEFKESELFLPEYKAMDSKKTIIIDETEDEYLEYTNGEEMILTYEEFIADFQDDHTVCTKRK